MTQKIVNEIPCAFISAATEMHGKPGFVYRDTNVYPIVSYCVLLCLLWLNFINEHQFKFN
jgi:hypothetical protein